MPGNRLSGSTRDSGSHREVSPSLVTLTGQSSGCLSCGFRGVPRRRFAIWPTSRRLLTNSTRDRLKTEPLSECRIVDSAAAHDFAARA